MKKSFKNYLIFLKRHTTPRTLSFRTCTWQEGGKVHHFNKQATTQSKKQTIANNKNNTREGEVSTRKRHGTTKQQRKARSNKPQ
jgi:hypothetical protein